MTASRSSAVIRPACSMAFKRCASPTDRIVSPKEQRVIDRRGTHFGCATLPLSWPPLGCRRNFQTRETVEKLLDLMAFYKLNRFHLHLTDDEGWRIEIKQLPELTKVGGHRGHTLDEAESLIPSHGSGPSSRSREIARQRLLHAGRLSSRYCDMPKRGTSRSFPSSICPATHELP